jgi:hypothetical protein
VVFTHRELADGEAQEVKSHSPFVLLEGVADERLARFQFQAHARQPVRDDFLALLDHPEVVMQDDQIVRITDHRRCPTLLLAIHPPGFRKSCRHVLFQTMQSDVRQQRGKHPALWRSCFRGEELPLVHYSSLQPPANDSFQEWKGVDFGQEGVVVDAVEAFRDVSIQDVLRLVSDLLKNCLDGIMAGPSRSEAVGVGLETRFPLRFENQLDQRLCCSFGHRGNAQRPLFLRAGLGYPYPTHRLGWSLQVQVRDQGPPLMGFQGNNPIDPRCLLALVVLSDTTYRQQLGRQGPQQQTL